MYRTAEVAVVRRIGVEVIADFWSRLAAFLTVRQLVASKPAGMAAACAEPGVAAWRG
ncbi:hypothetical protein CHLRE_01g025726v5 [Chlamydomonas reinhardtii]|uniref:Uncharacterized protein n=1 Tax=Chlamydomonas reinhardtii TaxID=3055 RepID=A0A2K3E6C6_CHLRE|nr:uncharacterized protein CHLRE_01g025726v5 [Chlamydomonas reinhardtii]PNW88351.1 hypothetical protein CHLRE_01g025726v5 [Chlamydomonas reinhardtii]